MKSPRKELLFVWVSLSIRVYAKAPVVARVWYCLCGDPSVVTVPSMPQTQPLAQLRSSPVRQEVRSPSAPRPDLYATGGQGAEWGNSDSEHELDLPHPLGEPRARSPGQSSAGGTGRVRVHPDVFSVAAPQAASGGRTSESTSS